MELQKAHSDSKFAASNAKAEADAAHEVNKALRRRIETLTSDLADVRAQFSNAKDDDRELVVVEQNEILQNDLLAERAKVRELEQAIDHMKVS